MKRMYKAVSLLLIAILAVSAACAGAYAADVSAGDTAVVGDVDGDGEATIDDVSILQGHLAEMYSLGNAALACADANLDGMPDVDDTTVIQRWLARFSGAFYVNMTLAEAKKKKGEDDISSSYQQIIDEINGFERSKGVDISEFNGNIDMNKLKAGTKRPRTDVPATPTAPVPKMKLGYAPAFLFAGFILVMMGWFVFNTVSYFANGTEKEYSPSEKRILADFPKVLSNDSDSKSFGENFIDAYKTIAGGDFGKGFETFFADHFPDRKLWVGTNAYATLFEGNNGANGVYYCGDGYLINTSKC